MKYPVRVNTRVSETYGKLITAWMVQYDVDKSTAVRQMLMKGARCDAEHKGAVDYSGMNELRRLLARHSKHPVVDSCVECLKTYGCKVDCALDKALYG